MATASVTNNFVNGNVADADAVDQNFTDLVDFLNDEVVHSDGANGPQFLQVRRTSNTTVANNTDTEVVWQAEDVDDWGGWTSGTDVTIVTTGLYEVKASVRWAGSVTAARLAKLEVNGTEQMVAYDAGASGTDTTQHLSRLINLTAADVVTLVLHQDSGSVMTYETGGTYLSLTLLRAA